MSMLPGLSFPGPRRDPLLAKFPIEGDFTTGLPETLQMPSVMANPGAPKKGGMFGAGKPDWTSAIQAALGGFLAARGNPGGAFLLNTLNQRRQQAMDEQRYNRQREDKFQDWVRQQDYQQAHQGPDDLTVLMQQAGVDPNSDQGRAYRLQALQNKINPFVAINQQNPDGSETRQFIRPPMAGLGMPAVGAVVDDPRQGGPMPQASGGFRF